MLALPARDPSHAESVRQLATFYGVSLSTVYPQLRELYRPKALQRADRGVPRVLSRSDAERFCEIFAALKI